MSVGVFGSGKAGSDAEVSGAALDERGQAWQVAEQIRQMIVRGTLSPGVHLSQAELAKSFGVSRFPIREALKLLAAETLVVHDLNRGYFVAALSSSEAKQLYRLRELVETELFKRLVWPDARRLKGLEMLLNELEKSSHRNPRSEWSHLHGEFQKALIQLSDQDVIVREAERLWVLTERYRSLLPFNPESSSRMVRRTEIFDALQSQNRRELIKAVDLGRREALDAVLTVLEMRRL